MSFPWCLANRLPQSSYSSLPGSRDALTSVSSALWILDFRPAPDQFISAGFEASVNYWRELHFATGACKFCTCLVRCCRKHFARAMIFLLCAFDRIFGAILLPHYRLQIHLAARSSWLVPASDCDCVIFRSWRDSLWEAWWADLSSPFPLIDKPFSYSYFKYNKY